MIRNILIGWFVLSTVLSAAEVPVLQFPEGFSWKGIFDAGFQPKHISGLEADMAECRDQEIILQFKDKGVFSLEKGRLAFHIQSDDSIDILEHTGRIPIDLEEAENRLESFHKTFSEIIVRKGSLPLIADEKDGIVNTYTGQSAVGVIDGFRISYRFTSSLQKEKPVIPMLVISHQRNKGELRPPIRRHIITPPEGYEDYDMTPEDPLAEFTKKAQKKRIEDHPKEENRDRADRYSNNQDQDSDNSTVKQSKRFPWIILGLVVLGSLFLLFKIFQGKSKP